MVCDEGSFERFSLKAMTWSTTRTGVAKSLPDRVAMRKNSQLDIRVDRLASSTNSSSDQDPSSPRMIILPANPSQRVFVPLNNDRAREYHSDPVKLT